MRHIRRGRSWAGSAKAVGGDGGGDGGGGSCGGGGGGGGGGYDDLEFDNSDFDELRAFYDATARAAARAAADAEFIYLQHKSGAGALSLPHAPPSSAATAVPPASSNAGSVGVAQVFIEVKDKWLSLFVNLGDPVERCERASASAALPRCCAATRPPPSPAHASRSAASTPSCGPCSASSQSSTCSSAAATRRSKSASASS